MADPILEDNLYALIKTFSAVTALVGTGSDARIYPDEFPQGETRQSLVIEVDEEDYEESEELTWHGGLVFASVIISAVSTRKREARALAEALRTNGTDPGTGLSGYDGAAGSASNIKAKLNKKRSGRVPEEDGSDSGRYAVDSYYTISFQEPQ